MSDIRKYIELLESAEKHSLYEGIKLGKKEIEETLKNSQDFQMGIEYEFLTPNPNNRTWEANDFIIKHDISHIDKVVPEHDDMMEIVSERMDISDGLEHIMHFFKSAKSYGITFPDTAGMHISISHKNAGTYFNFAKFLVLISAGYLHSIFPKRKHVENIENIMIKLLRDEKPNSLSEFEEVINDSAMRGTLSDKYVTTKLSDYSKHDGRIELRFFGGENYNTMYSRIKWELLRSVYILSISLSDDMYRKEYLKKVGKLIDEAKHFISPLDALNEMFNNRDNIPMERIARLEDVIATEAKTSFEYANYVMGGRFEKGEDAISTTPYHSYMYALNVLNDRFKKGENAILTNPEYILAYAENVINGRFLKGEEAIMVSENVLTYYHNCVDGFWEEYHIKLTNEIYNNASFSDRKSLVCKYMSFLRISFQKTDDKEYVFNSVMEDYIKPTVELYNESKNVEFEAELSMFILEARIIRRQYKQGWEQLVSIMSDNGMLED